MEQFGRASHNTLEVKVPTTARGSTFVHMRTVLSCRATQKRGPVLANQKERLKEQTASRSPQAQRVRVWPDLVSSNLDSEARHATWLKSEASPPSNEKYGSKMANIGLLVAAPYQQLLW